MTVDIGTLADSSSTTNLISSNSFGAGQLKSQVNQDGQNMYIKTRFNESLYSSSFNVLQSATSANVMKHA